MLILTRKLNQEIYLDTPAGRVVLTVVAIRNNEVRLGFAAPAEVTIVRREVEERNGSDGKQA